jgi:hypothetical protein
LLKDAEQYPAAYGQAQVLAVRGALAVHKDQPEEAQRLYQEGLARFPETTCFASA